MTKQMKRMTFHPIFIPMGREVWVYEVKQVTNIMRDYGVVYGN